MKWPHGPTHWLFEPGIYIVTASTYQKLRHLNSTERLDFFLESLFDCANEFDWNLRAWAVLPNHYHFIAASSQPGTLRKFLGKLHMQTSKHLNLWDNTPGRKVWFQFWDSHITFERSYLARLNYVHHNPARHGICPVGAKLQVVLGLMVRTLCIAWIRKHCEIRSPSGHCCGIFLPLPLCSPD